MDNNIPAIITLFKGKDLSKICNVSEATISRWKSGSRFPSRKNLEKILEFTKYKFKINDLEIIFPPEKLLINNLEITLRENNE